MSTKTIFCENKVNEKGEFYLPKLSFEYSDLEPFMDKETVQIHYEKHHQTYVNNLNAIITNNANLAKHSIEEILMNLEDMPQDIKTGLRNFGGGHANHALYWDILGNNKSEPSKELSSQINKFFGSFSDFKDKLSKVSIGTFGSGWGWLSVNQNKELILESSYNQDSPLTLGHTPLMVIDVWEHAYYLKYQNRRAEFVENIFSIINWDKVSLRYEQAV